MIVLGSRSNKIRKRWRQALTGCYPIHEIGDEIALRQALAQYKPAVLLLDSDAIHHRGIRYINSLLRANPHTRIIFFTDQVKDDEALTILKAGASGYCAKNITGAFLRKAVDAVSGGEIWAKRQVISLFIRRAVSLNADRKEGFTKYNSESVAPVQLVLSPRECDIASMIAIGEHNKTISSHLSISEKTVKAHLTNIFKKLGFSSRTQLALFVRANEFSRRQAISIPDPAQRVLNYNKERAI